MLSVRSSRLCFLAPLTWYFTNVFLEIMPIIQATLNRLWWRRLWRYCILCNDLQQLNSEETPRPEAGPGLGYKMFTDCYAQLMQAAYTVCVKYICLESTGQQQVDRSGLLYTLTKQAWAWSDIHVEPLTTALGQRVLLKRHSGWWCCLARLSHAPSMNQYLYLSTAQASNKRERKVLLCMTHSCNKRLQTFSFYF